MLLLLLWWLCHKVTYIPPPHTETLFPTQVLFDRQTERRHHHDCGGVGMSVTERDVICLIDKERWVRNSNE